MRKVLIWLLFRLHSDTWKDTVCGKKVLCLPRVEEKVDIQKIARELNELQKRRLRVEI